MLVWLIFHRGGGFKRFYPLKFPGFDDLSRWMSMAIYYSKIHACSKVFQLSDEEETDTLLATQFTTLFYDRHWFKASLAAPAARNDLTYMSIILSKAAFTLLQASYQQL